jgi:drug/metabolite transporter (DMT)-like permease
MGMTGYVLAINNIGASYTAIISSLFPAVGALLAFIFLKEKMRFYQIIGLIVSIIGIIVLSYTPNGEVTNFVIGLIGALMCVFGWSAEAVICAYGLKDPHISDEQALQIRQLTSTIFYALIILPVIKGWGFTLDAVFAGKAVFIILVSALFGTASYVFYYKAIIKIGASKAMALNITYASRAIVFSFAILKSVPSVMGIICAVVIMLGSITASTNIEELFPKKRTKPCP